MSTNLYRCTPRQARKFMIEVMDAKLVPFLQSSPGVGKSAITWSIADQFRLFGVDTRLSSAEPTDISGFGAKNDRGRATYLPFDHFPLAQDKEPEGYEGWLLFFDEFNSAPRSVQAAAYQVVLDRKVGFHKLHEKVAIAAAGNLATDRAITNNLSTAMQSRLVHLELEVNFEEWLEDVALPQNYDPRVIAYLSQHPAKLMDFRPDHQDRTFCCPRTWEFTHRLIQGKTLSDDYATLLAGTITSGTAVEFVQFTKIYQDLITLADVLKDPAACPVPEDISISWATISQLMGAVDASNYATLSTYVDRYSMDFKILFHRSVMVRHPKLRMHPAYTKAMSTLSRYLHAAA